MAGEEFLKFLGGQVLEKGVPAAEKISRGGLAALDLAVENPQILPNIEKLRAEEEPDLFTHVFGIPTPFMQLGTYLGVQGWKGLALDVIADPTNYLGGMGKLLRKASLGGRVERAVGGAIRTKEALEASQLARAEARVQAAEKGVSEAEDLAKGIFEYGTDKGFKVAPTAEGPVGLPFVEALHNMASKLSDLVNEIGFKATTSTRKVKMLAALGKRSAQLDAFGHQRVLDLLSLANDDREAVDIIDQLQKLRAKPELVEVGSKEGGFSRFTGYRPGEEKTFEFGRKATKPGYLEKPQFSIGPQRELAAGAPEAINPLLQHLPGKTELDGIRNTILREGLEKGRSALQEMIDKRKDLSALVSSFADAGSVKEAIQIAKQIDKLEPNRSFQVLFGSEGRRRWKSYFDQLGGTFKTAAEGATVEALGRTAEEQIAKGQRNLLTVSVPFIPGSERVIATGAPLVSALVDIGQSLKKLPILNTLTKVTPAFHGAGAEAAYKAGAFNRMAAYDSVGQIGDQLFRNYAGGGLGTPENVDSIFKQYYALRENATGLAAIWGDEIRGAARGKDDLLRLAFDNPKDFFETKDVYGRPLLGRGFDDNFTKFDRELLKKEHAGKFDDLDLAFLQTLESVHTRMNKTLVANGMLAGALENYLPRLVKKVNKPGEWEAFLRQIPERAAETKSHFRKRSIPLLSDVFELEKKGVIEVEHDLGLIETHWANEVLKTAQQKRLYDRLKAARLPHDGEEGVLPLMTREGSKEFKIDPNAFVRTKNPNIIRAFKPGGRGVPRSIVVHKDYIKDMEVAFGGQPLTAGAGLPTEQRLADSLLKLNAVTKRAVMGSDLVNYGWFTERAAGTLGSRWLRSPIAQTRMGAYHRARATDLWDLAYKSGLKGFPIEQDLDTYSHALNAMANWADGAKIPFVGRAMRTWRAFSAGIEQPAWAYYHPSLKMNAFSELYSKALTDSRFAKIPANEIAEGVAAHVNNAFSGLNWERMWVGAPGQKWLRLMFVAPDWMLSSVRLGADLFANQVKRLPFLGRDMVAPEVRAAYARDYAVRAGFFTAGLMELANLATSSDPMHFLKTGHLNGHYMDQNEEGHRTQLALPVREDGKQLYWVPQKQWQDLYAAASDPFRFLGNRIGLIPNLYETVVLGRDSFGYPIVSTKEGFAHQLAQRLGWVASSSLLPSYLQTSIGVGSANPRPLRGALEFGLSIRTGREVAKPTQESSEAPQEVINLQQEPAPPPDPIPPEFEQALAQELQENPSYTQALNEYLRRMSKGQVQGLFDRVMAGRR